MYNITNKVLEDLSSSLPPVFSRSKAEELLGGMICARTLANLDSAGKGPANFRCGSKKVCYRREDFLSWLAARLEV